MTITRDRLRCYRDGHDFRLLVEPVRRRTGDQVVEWCPRCHRIRPQQAAPDFRDRAAVVKTMAVAGLMGEVCIHAGAYAFRVARVTTTGVHHAISWWIEHRRRPTRERPSMHRAGVGLRYVRRGVSWWIEHERREVARVQLRLRIDPTEAAAENEPEIEVADNPPAPRLDLTALENILHIEEAGTSGLIVDTADGRRLRVSANREPASGLFFASYETLGAFNRRKREILAWQPTSRYGAAVANTVEECLEATLAEIEAGPRRPRQKSRSSMRARKPPPSRVG